MLELDWCKKLLLFHNNNIIIYIFMGTYSNYQDVNINNVFPNCEAFNRLQIDQNQQPLKTPSNIAIFQVQGWTSISLARGYLLVYLIPRSCQPDHLHQSTIDERRWQLYLSTSQRYELHRSYYESQSVWYVFQIWRKFIRYLDSERQLGVTLGIRRTPLLSATINL